MTTSLKIIVTIGNVCRRRHHHCRPPAQGHKQHCPASRLGAMPLLPTYADHEHDEDEDKGNNATPPVSPRLLHL
jgi:hypothetical protein